MAAGTLLVATGIANERTVLEHWAVSMGYWPIVLQSRRCVPDELPTNDAVLVFDESSGLVLDEVGAIASCHRIAGIAILGPESDWTPDAILAAGCVDFLRRPYHSDDAFARIHRALCTGVALDAAPDSETIARVGEVAIDTTTREVRFRGRSVTLRRAECNVLLRLARNFPNTVTQSEIIENVLGSHGDGTAARNQIWELRRKLAALGLETAIETLRGSKAYRLRPPHATFPAGLRRSTRA